MLLNDFYSVENSTNIDDAHSTEIKINRHHRLYQGHFPHRPVTPGVILMQLFKEEAERLTGQNLQLEKAMNVKFMAVVDPNEDENFVLQSSIEETADYIHLKGMAKHKGAIALKISAVYKILN